MIRSAIRHITAPLLGLLAPEILAEILAERSRADVATGERNEARHGAYRARVAEAAAAHLGATDEQIAAMGREIETLQSEARDCNADNSRLTVQLAQAEVTIAMLTAAQTQTTTERDTWRDTADRRCVRTTQLEAEAAELRRRCDDFGARVRVLDSDIADRRRIIGEHEATIGAHRHEIDDGIETARRLGANTRGLHLRGAIQELANQRDHWRFQALAKMPTMAEADTAEPVKVEACAWCLVAEDGAEVFSEEDNDERIVLCSDHAVASAEPTMAELWDRVALRAASCPARRGSADPLAKACPTCEAPAGKPCDETAYQNEAG